MFYLCGEFITKEALKETGDLKSVRRGIKTVKNADNLIMLAKEKEELQNKIDKLVEIGRRPKAWNGN